ncbi:glycosyltransferase involved in cell wall biosynthesis [Salinibacter ruber]|uniref:glycosyltransferase family 2 protein n=1 Tax=Salinibacter ruber TaxID=146919 RepID=UPI002169726B|nr:glycosyltransferase family 2 protein [Salinibacter ruber]MCS3863257.1 glycosyltransferase involved in cell wall biosynthesis [Salinibacter ruber]
MKLVSIVIPTRNRKNLLRQAIESAVNQSWPALEVIVIDEASEDGTSDMIKQYKKQVEVFRNEKPEGLPAVRNMGASLSNGDYVLHLDDDDLLHPDHVAELVRFSEGLSEDQIASSGWRRFHITGGDVTLDRVIRPPSSWKAPEAINAIFGHNPGCLIWTSSVLWPRSVLNELEFDESLPHDQEVDFYSRVLLAGYEFVGTKSGMAYYRTHGGGRRSTPNSKHDIISSAKCRLKHAKLLRKKSYKESVASGVRSGLMRVLMGLAAYNGVSDWIEKVEKEYKQWGGKGYYLPQPPESRLKRQILQAALHVGGIRLVGSILRIKRTVSKEKKFDESSKKVWNYKKTIRNIKKKE